ncbi:hypothetical protein E8E14_010650 [Neopestalotiopsis sp. 37M]|nr:hypothetical protein E8E14_010650 [Neopestalotiopsis sp. 37M]
MSITLTRDLPFDVQFPPTCNEKIYFVRPRKHRGPTTNQPSYRVAGGSSVSGMFMSFRYHHYNYANDHNGLRFGVFEHRVNAGGEDIAIPYDVAESTVLDSGTIKNLNFDIDIPSQTMLLDGRNMTAKWRGINAAGYFVARSAGTYTFSSPREEFRDEGFFWHGDVAYDRWGDQNFIGGQENYDYMVDHDRWISGAVSITLSAGQVMPIRYIWVNAFASYVMCVCDTDYGSSRLWITTPEGEVVKNTTGWFIRGCSDTTFSGIVNV